MFCSIKKLATVFFVKFLGREGITLIELLVVMAIAGILFAGVGGLSMTTLRSARLASSVLSEVELRETINGILSHQNSCEKNLKPSIGGIDSTTGVGVITALKSYRTNIIGGRVLVKTGDFKNDLDIVKIKLTRESTDTANPKTTTPSVPRELKVFFKRKGVSIFSTKSNGVCSALDQTGCYEVTCKLNYKIKNDGTNDVAVCTSEDCAGHLPSGGGSGDIKCADGTSAVKVQPDGTTLFGCGTTKNNPDGTTAFGFNAGKVGSGSDNTFIGHSSGKKTTGTQNTFIGKSAGQANTTGGYNTFIGTQAGMENTAGDNIFIGVQAGYKNKGGNQNTFVGTWAGSNNITGSRNTFFGWNAGNKNTANENTFVGADTGKKNTTGGSNTFLGYQAGNNTTTGLDNVFIGKDAGKASRNNKWG